MVDDIGVEWNTVTVEGGDCGRCFEKSDQWASGEPFVDEYQQTKAVREFFQNVVLVASCEVTIPSGVTVQPGSEEECFGYQPTLFPTSRRVERRSWDTSFHVGCNQEEWVRLLGIQLGEHLSSVEREEAIRLLWIWRDVFVDRMEDLPVTDLVVHTIPTYPDAKAYRAWDPIYAKDEIRWQTTMLPGMIGSITSSTNWLFFR